MNNEQEKATAYWKENVRYLIILLSIWFLVSFGAGILFKDALNSIKLVILIFIYVRLMNKLDKKYGYDR